MLSKRGQTLVEVVVALGILATVFGGTIVLIINAVNLEYSARKKTEAISIAQKKLAETISAIQNRCDKTMPANSNGQTNGYNFTTTINSTNFSYGNNLNNQNFAEIIVNIDWNNKGLPGDSYEIRQVIKK